MTVNGVAIIMVNSVKVKKQGSTTLFSFEATQSKKEVAIL